MLNQYNRRLMRLLRSQNITCYRDNMADDDEEIIFPLCFKEFPAIIFRAHSTDSGKTYLTAKLGTAEDEDDKAELYPIINELNCKYSFSSIYIGESGSIYCDIQFLIDDNTSDEILNAYIDAIISISKSSAIRICRFLTREKPPVTCDIDIDDFDFDGGYDEYDDYDEYDGCDECDEPLEPELVDPEFMEEFEHLGVMEDLPETKSKIKMLIDESIREASESDSDDEEFSTSDLFEDIFSDEGESDENTGSDSENGAA